MIPSLFIEKMNIDFSLNKSHKAVERLYVPWKHSKNSKMYYVSYFRIFFFKLVKPLALVEIVFKSFIFYFSTPPLLWLKTATCIFPYMFSSSVHLANSWNYNVNFIVRWHSTVGKTTSQNTQMNSNQFKPRNTGEGGKAEGRHYSAIHL